MSIDLPDDPVKYLRDLGRQLDEAQRGRDKARLLLLLRERQVEALEQCQREILKLDAPAPE